MSEKTFRCRECDTRTDSFLDDCPSCGGQSYERMLDEQETGDRDPVAELAKLSRPVNPLVPV